MSSGKDDFPRDLRGFLLGGTIENDDGSQSILYKPIRSYDNLWTVRRAIESAIADPETSIEERESFQQTLDALRQESTYLRKRILEQFSARPQGHRSRESVPPSIRGDHGVRNKVEKALDDIEAGEFQSDRTSNTLAAVLQAMSYYRKTGKMPSHAELMEFGYTKQQATDAGAWLAEQHLDPIFLPLTKSKRGPKPKKK